MIDCTDCDGTGRAFAFVNTGPDISQHRQEHRWCPTCGGRGHITADQALRIARGKRVRQSRLERGETLADAAERIGLSPVELSAIEAGRRT